jgi:hypothetical protein
MSSIVQVYYFPSLLHFHLNFSFPTSSSTLILFTLIIIRVLQSHLPWPFSLRSVIRLSSQLRLVYSTNSIPFFIIPLYNYFLSSNYLRYYNFLFILIYIVCPLVAIWPINWISIIYLFVEYMLFNYEFAKTVFSYDSFQLIIKSSSSWLYCVLKCYLMKWDWILNVISCVV